MASDANTAPVAWGPEPGLQRALTKGTRATQRRTWGRPGRFANARIRCEKLASNGKYGWRESGQ